MAIDLDFDTDVRENFPIAADPLPAPRCYGNFVNFKHWVHRSPGNTEAVNQTCNLKKREITPLRCKGEEVHHVNKKEDSGFKKFWKKHKTAILITIAAAVIVTVVVVVVVATAGTGAAAGGAVAGAAGGAAAASNDDKDKKPANSKPSSSEQTQTTAPAKNEPKPSFGEQVRNAGAQMAHQALDGVATVGSVIPQLSEEINQIGAKINPEYAASKVRWRGSPIQRYRERVASGHKKIDQMFSTDQAELYIPEMKALIQEYDPRSYAVLPPPSTLTASSICTRELLEAGKAIDRAGFTKAGRALMKHGYRGDTVFPKPVGNPAQVNAHGQKMLELILNHPERKIAYENTKKFGPIMDVEVPGVGGVRFSGDGKKMIGFLEP